MECVIPFLVLAAGLWAFAWILLRKAWRRTHDAQFQRRLGDLLEGDPVPQVGNRPSPWLWVGGVLLALLAFGVSLCTGAVLTSGFVR